MIYGTLDQTVGGLQGVFTGAGINVTNTITPNADLTFGVVAPLKPAGGAALGSVSSTLTATDNSGSLISASQFTVANWNAGQRAVTYDPRGNLTQDHQNAYAYDALSQLTGVNGSTLTYDGLGRLRTYTETNGIVTRLIYAGHRVIQEIRVDPAHNTSSTVNYTYGLDYNAPGHQLLARTDAAGTAFYHQDANGNVVDMTDASGNAVAQYLYEAYGQLIAQRGKLAEVNLYRFSSERYVPGSRLYYYGYRFYSPELRRWLNNDPIGFAGGRSLYMFVGNDPVNYFDLLGFGSNPVMGLGGAWNSNPYGSGGSFYSPGYLYTPPMSQPLAHTSTFAGGLDYHLSWINPGTSRGGGIVGKNQMTFFGKQNQTKCFEYNGSGEGFDDGVAYQSVWALGSGDWTGTFDSVAVNFAVFTGSVFWSPGEGGWIGFTFGLSYGPPGAAYEETEYYDDINE